MPVLEHRVSRLEEVLERFIEHTEDAHAIAREEMAEFRAAQARADRETLRLRRESEARWEKFEQQAEKDRKEADERWIKFEQQADKDRKGSDERWIKFEQQADKDRQELAKNRAESEKNRQESDERWIKFEQQADKDRQAIVKIQEEADVRWKEFEQRAEASRQQADKDRQQADKDRQEANNRWKEFEQRAEASRQQADKDRRDFNKRQAEISDRIGRFVEEMVHPNAARIAGKLFGDDPIETLAIRVKRRHPQDASRMIELDLLVAGSRHLLIGEAKSTPTVEKSNAFLEKVAEIAEFFPEYAGLKVLPLLASVSFEPSLVAHLSRQKVYALGFGDNTMELLNEGAF